MNTDKQTWQEKALKEISEIIYDYNFHTDNSATKLIINWIEQNKELIGQEEWLRNQLAEQVKINVMLQEEINELKSQSIPPVTEKI